MSSMYKSLSLSSYCSSFSWICHLCTFSVRFVGWMHLGYVLCRSIRLWPCPCSHRVKRRCGLRGRAVNQLVRGQQAHGSVLCGLFALNGVVFFYPNTTGNIWCKITLSKKVRRVYLSFPPSLSRNITDRQRWCHIRDVLRSIISPSFRNK